MSHANPSPPAPLPPEALRWRCDPAALGFVTTETVEPLAGIVGQDRAMDALDFGLQTDAPGHNVFLRGLTGTGRVTLVRQLLEGHLNFCPRTPDRCYVHDPEQPDRPKLISLPPGRGRKLRDRMDAVVGFLARDLDKAMQGDAVRNQRTALEARHAEELQARQEPFQQQLATAGLTLVHVRTGEGAQKPAILPLVDGQPMPLEQLRQGQQQGKWADLDLDGLKERMLATAKQHEDLSFALHELNQAHQERIKELYERELRRVVGAEMASVHRDFQAPEVPRFLDSVLSDLLKRFEERGEVSADLLERYRVQVVRSTDEHGGCPVVAENAPTLLNLLGTVDPDAKEDGVTPPHLRIRGGALLAADGGYLILEAREVLAHPSAWRALSRTLRTGLLEIAPPEAREGQRGPGIKPEPIPVQVKVVLIGDPGLYGALDMGDPDFGHLFKVLADFEEAIPRDDSGLARYAGVLRRLIDTRNLPHFSAEAVALLAEHGARIAGRQDKLTARLGRIADVAQEAAFISHRGTHGHASDNGGPVQGEHVRRAIAQRKQRANLPAERFREAIQKGSLNIQASGETVGQIYGLAVISAGPITYGIPSRITASVGAGQRGATNIEQEAELSGNIHTKGFQILSGLLRTLLPVPHPLVFDGSIAFEQSYGMIDGDSASGAQAICLLSAWSGLPLRQNLAITGAIDQLGRLQAIGAATEKIEGFFDVCVDQRVLTPGSGHGVVIPQANAGDLMLREDVVAACQENRFAVYAVDTIHQALALFTGRAAGERDADGWYPPDSVLGMATSRATGFWQQVKG